jgi:hypothetical protein
MIVIFLQNKERFTILVEEKINVKKINVKNTPLLSRNQCFCKFFFFVSLRVLRGSLPVSFLC